MEVSEASYGCRHSSKLPQTVCLFMQGKKTNVQLAVTTKGREEN